MAPIDIGTLQGTLAMKNAYSDEFAKFDQEVKTKLVGGVKNFSEQTRAETIRIQGAYQRVAASLDPVTANTIKYQRAEVTLTAALKAGIITQDQYNKSLAQAKDKYTGVNASTSTWRDEIQKLTGAISPLSPRLAGIASLADEIKSSLVGSSAATDIAAASAGTATTSFATLSAALIPLLPLLAALAVVAGTVIVAFKGFTFLRDITQEGVQTQLVIEKLDNTLRATGSYARLSSADLVALAESYELLTGESKEQIIAAETILARFETLNREVYPEALRVTLSYAKAMGTTAEEAAKRLGPALEGTIGSLKDAGIVLTASQRKVLTEMVETGRVSEYQSILLGILREKVEGLSEEYDKNLSRQVNRAKIVLNDFGEAIANQVIPALEDVFSEIIESLGGWDNLKKTVNEVGAAVGNFIRTGIYALFIAYHGWQERFDNLVSTILKGASHIVRGHGLIFRSADSLARADSLANLSKDFAESANSHRVSVLRLTKNLLDHRVALEGNTEVYESNGSALDDIITKNAELDRQTEELTEKYRDNTIELERLFALRMLATKGPLDPEFRIAEEERINQLYKDRLDFLKLEEKFGTAVAESLMEVQKGLRDLELKAKVELELATKLRPIEIDLKAIFKNLAGPVSVSKLSDIVAVEEKNREEFRKSREEYDKWVESIASGWIERFKSMRDIAEGEIEGVKEAVARGLMTVEEGERAIAQIRQDVFSENLATWTGILTQLGDSLGGFFAQLASIAQSIQGVDQTAQSLGGWQTAMGAWGGTIAAFVELYKFADSIIEKHKSEKYGTRTGLSVTRGIDVSSFTSQVGMELSRSIQEVLKAFEDQLRISVDDLADIEIRLRNNGKDVQAWVKGEWIGTFTDVNTAIREALIVAMADPDSSLRGLSDLMAEGIAKWTSPDMEGLLEFLTDLREISDLSLSPLVINLQESALKFNEMRETLRKLDQSSQAVINAQLELTEAQNRLFEQTRAQLLGIDLSAAEGIRNLAGFVKGMDQVSDSMKKGLQDSLAAAEARLRALEREASGGITSTGGGQGVSGSKDPGLVVHTIIKYFSDTLGDVSEGISDEQARLKAAIEEYKKQLAEVPEALTDMEIDLGVYTVLENALKKSGKHAELIAQFERIRVEEQFKALRLSLIAAGAWERWADIWQDLYAEAMAEAGTMGRAPRGGGRGASEKDQVRDFVKDRRFELSLTGLTEYEKAKAELNKQYDDLIEQAGKDKKLRGDLIALRERELKLLRQEHAESTREKFQEFLGLVTPFDKVRKTAADLIKEIQGSAFGDPRKAAMIGRVLADVNRQLDIMSKEMAVSLFGQMISDMQRFGATEAQMSEARQHLALFEHQLRLINYQQTIAQLELEGRLSAEVIASLKEGYEFLAGIDPLLFINPPPPGPDDDRDADRFSTYSSTSNVVDEFENRLKSVQDKLAEWNRVPLSETLARAHEMTDSFSALMADVEKLKPFGWDYTAIAQETFRKMVEGFIDDTLSQFEDSGSELENQLRGIGAQFRDINAALVHLGASHADLERAERARLNAIKRVLDQYLDPIREFRQNRQMGPLSTLTSQQMFNESRNRFRDLFAQIRAGDLTNIEDVVPLAQQYGELLQSFTGGGGLRFGLKEIDDTLLAIERLVPNFAAQMAEVGSEENPMFVDSSNMVEAINANMEAVNNGNTLMLAEMRTSVDEMKTQTNSLWNIEQTLSNPISVRNVA